MPTHMQLLKQISKLAGGAARMSTGVDYGRSYRDYKSSKKQRVRVYFQPAHIRQKNAINKMMGELSGLLAEGSRYRVGVYKRSPYTRGKPYQATVRRKFYRRPRDRGGYY